jgi:three-Cys-motif partner protein
MTDPYQGRTQTKAKHFILRRYLETLTYKLFASGYRELTYVDGFSGPWGSKTDTFADTSFMIAIDVLKNAHWQFRAKNKLKITKCFFVEEDPKSFQKLEASVRPYHQPADNFHVATFEGRFENAISEILKFVGRSFALVFIDPTGWTGYPYDRIKPILTHRPNEVLINFMYDHINRASSMGDPKTVASLDRILGGPGWKTRLSQNISKGLAVEQLFREELKKAGAFKYVLSTRIDKATADRPHYFIAYCTMSPAGVKAFRQVEFDALKGHEKVRVQEKVETKKKKTGQEELFKGEDVLQNQSIISVVRANCRKAKAWITSHLRERKAPVRFESLCTMVLEQFMLRETDVKNICVDLANEGVIKVPWKLETPKKLKPHDRSVIELVA